MDNVLMFHILSTSNPIYKIPSASYSPLWDDIYMFENSFVSQAKLIKKYMKMFGKISLENFKCNKIYYLIMSLAILSEKVKIFSPPKNRLKRVYIWGWWKHFWRKHVFFSVDYFKSHFKSKNWKKIFRKKNRLNKIRLNIDYLLLNHALCHRADQSPSTCADCYWALIVPFSMTPSPGSCSL